MIVSRRRKGGRCKLYVYVYVLLVDVIAVFRWLHLVRVSRRKCKIKCKHCFVLVDVIAVIRWLHLVRVSVRSPTCASEGW